MTTFYLITIFPVVSRGGNDLGGLFTSLSNATGFFYAERGGCFG